MKENSDSLYNMVGKFLSEGCAVVYAVGEGISIPTNQLVNRMYSNLRQSGSIGDIEDYIRTGTLRIMDAREIYSSDLVGNTAAMLDKWMSIIKEFRERKFKNIIIIAGGTTALSDSDKQNNLVAYEQAILETVKKTRSVHVICCYLQESLDKMQFDQIASIVNAHQCNVIPVTTGVESRRIGPSIILDAIVDGIEDVMGKDSGKLIMQTMKTVYKINEEGIVSNPSLFQEKLQKILGNTSKMVLDSASKKIKEIMLLVGIVVVVHSIFSSMMLLERLK